MSGAWEGGRVWKGYVAERTSEPIISWRLSFLLLSPKLYPLSLISLLTYPRLGPSYTMRRVALSALLVVAASSVASAEESKPVFKVRVTTLVRKRVQAY